MLRVPQNRPGLKLSGPGCCVISGRPGTTPGTQTSRPTPSSSLRLLATSHPFTQSDLHEGPLACPERSRRATALVTPLLPLLPGNSPVSPLFPLLTQKQGVGGIFVRLLFAIATYPLLWSSLFRLLLLPTRLPISPRASRGAISAKGHSPLATNSNHSRTIGNCCPTSRTPSNIYHYITYPCRRADNFAAADDKRQPKSGPPPRPGGRGKRQDGPYTRRRHPRAQARMPVPLAGAL